jgi:hypothetical protein
VKKCSLVCLSTSANTSEMDPFILTKSAISLRPLTLESDLQNLFWWVLTK